MDVHLIFPRGAFGASDDDAPLEAALRRIAVAAAKVNGDDGWVEKYGTDFENDVFMMHSFCWCEKMDCPWCNGELPEGQTVRKYSYPENEPFEDDWCSAPNFVFKPSGLKVWWYKIHRSRHGNQPSCDRRRSERDRTGVYCFAQ